MDVPSVFQGRVHIYEIHLNLDEITVERTAQGTVNVMEIGAVKKRPQPAAAPQQPSQSTKPPSMEIDRVVLSLGRARYIDGGAGPASLKTFSLDIKQAVLRNVTDPAQITQQIVFKTLQKVGLNTLTQELQKFGLNWNAGESGASEQLKEAWTNLKGKFKF